MNYLAHLYLSGDSPEARLGNLMGDFVRGTDLDGYSEAVRQGIRLHRRIDAFTDSHPVVACSRRLVAPERRRYAGILVDIFYDHFLAKAWPDYSSIPLAEYAAGVYQMLRESDTLLPERLRRTAAAMSAGDWLCSYAHFSGVEAALARASRRLTRENPLAASGDELTTNYEALKEHFETFFPGLIEFAGLDERAVSRPEGRGL